MSFLFFRLKLAEFLLQYGHLIVTVREDDPEYGEFLILYPEEYEYALELSENYKIVTVFLNPDDPDNDIVGNEFNNEDLPNKVGFYALIKE